MPTNWPERDTGYWAPREIESFPGYNLRVARQLAALCGKLIDEVEDSLGDSLTKEAADRLIDSLGGPDAGLVSPAVLQDHLVPKQIAKAEGDKDA